MNFRTRQPEQVDINLTPLIDVVFLMLIFFMVSTTFERHAELNIDLPGAETTEQAQRQEVIDLAIDEQGRYFINGQELVNTRAETLRTALDQASAGDTSRPLVIRADAKTPHQSVVTAMDVASRLGLSRLSIATTQSRDDN
ncbi:MAG: ExbD/TolR family protein [Thioalkalivibrio sp.]